jgi:hypothetical protein
MIRAFLVCLLVIAVLWPGPASANPDALPCPTRLVAEREPNGIHLTWDPVEGADGYIIYRSINGGPFLFAGFLTRTAAIDNSNLDDGIDITNAARSYTVTATFGQQQSSECPVAGVVAVPFFSSAGAWVMAIAGLLSAAGVLTARRWPPGR